MIKQRCASSTLFQIHQENNDVFLQFLFLDLDEPLWSFLEVIRGGLVSIQTTETKTKPRVHLQDWNFRLKAPQSKLCVSKSDAHGQVPASHPPGRQQPLAARHRSFANSVSQLQKCMAGEFVLCLVMKSKITFPS